MKILLIEDNRDLATNLFDYFEKRGHVMDHAGDGIPGLHLVSTNAYDVVVLDWMMPSMDGITFCKRVREAGKQTPILMLTARDALEDKVAGLEAGADDYVVKPFAMREVEARLLALVRRSQSREGAGVLRVADLSFDTVTLKIIRGVRPISLPPIALKLLELLMRQAPRVIPREELERELWGDLPPDSDALRAHLHVLRNAIDKPGEVPLVKTWRGIGYQIGHE